MQRGWLFRDNMAVLYGSCVSSTVVLVFALTVAYGSVPIITRIESSMLNQMRTITIRYEAEEKPVVLWTDGSFFKYLDNTTNSFSGTEGVTTVHMYIDFRYTHHDVNAFIYADSYQLSLFFNEGNMNQSLSNTISPLKLKAEPDGTVDFDVGETVNIELTLESQDLGSFEMIDSWGYLTAFDYESLPSATIHRRSISQRDRYHHQRNAFIMPELNISGTAGTTESTTAAINTSFPYTEGEVQFGVKFGVNAQYSLLDRIILSKWVYLKEISHDAPFSGVIFTDDPNNRKRVDYISDRWLYTQADSMGYPKPEVKLHRECTELREPELKIYTIGTPYRTRKIFQFRNASDSLTGTYYFSAVSGDKEMTRMNYITML